MIFNRMFWVCFRKKNIQFLLILLILLVIVYNINLFGNSQLLNKSQKHLVMCHFQDKREESLPELNSNEVTENSIYFFETSCNHKNGIQLNLRQGCAIESAALLNPDSTIFVLFLAPNFVDDKSHVIDMLNSYNNVNLRYINLQSYANNTPLQNFITSKTIFTSNWPVSHTSDLLRFLTLWKFGGTYLDLDVVLMKSLNTMSNFVSAESDTAIASLVLNFGTDKLGKLIANITVHDYANNYRGDNWGYNGPGVITRALQKICSTENISEMTKDKCQGFTVYDRDTFCPVSWKKWYSYFNSETSDEVMKKLNNSIGIHVWNLHSKNTVIKVGSKQPYGLVAQKYCPKVFSLAKTEF